jgi:hypothetical protein
MAGQRQIQARLALQERPMVALGATAAAAEMVRQERSRGEAVAGQMGRRK